MKPKQNNESLLLTLQELKAIEAAIDQFKDMVEGGSEDARHEHHHITLKKLLNRAKVKNYRE